MAEGVSKPHKTSRKRAGEKLSRRSYSDAEIERALIAVAFANGNTHMASRELAEAEFPIDQKTLWRWSRKIHAERYESMQVEVLPALRARAAEEHMDIAAQQMSVVRQMTERLTREVPEISARDLPGGIRNVTTAAAVHTDKAQLLQGEPTNIVRQDFGEIRRTLEERHGVRLVLDGEAEELPDQEPKQLSAGAGDGS